MFSFRFGCVVVLFIVVLELGGSDESESFRESVWEEWIIAVIIVLFKNPEKP